MGNCLSMMRLRRRSFEIYTGQPIGIARLPTGLTGLHIAPSKSSEPNTQIAVQHSLNNYKDITHDDQYGPPESSTTDMVLNAYKFEAFGYNTLKVATNKFSKRTLLGQGGSAEVYKGWIDPATMTAAKRKVGHPIAVKRLKKERVQGRKEWLNEVNFLKRFNHPNVVKLIGFCYEDDHSILVYEFMPKGSLEASLLKERNNELNWSRRIKIAVGSAKGLEYLHVNSTPVIHRDIKSSNILLDNDFTPKISDFGLAKLGPQGDKSHTSSRVLGTRGYFAPEYILTGHLTMKTDVYSFGVVLLEIFSGRVTGNRSCSNGIEDLVVWGKRYLGNTEKLHHLIDKKPKGTLTQTEAQKFANIISQCLDKNPEQRPTISDVVHDLEAIEKRTYLQDKSIGNTTKIPKHFHSQQSNGKTTAHA